MDKRITKLFDTFHDSVLNIFDCLKENNFINFKIKDVDNIYNFIDDVCKFYLNSKEMFIKLLINMEEIIELHVVNKVNIVKDIIDDVNSSFLQTNYLQSIYDLNVKTLELRDTKFIDEDANDSEIKNKTIREFFDYIHTTLCKIIDLTKETILFYNKIKSLVEQKYANKKEKSKEGIRIENQRIDTIDNEYNRFIDFLNDFFVC